jgi:hypothetical protein
VLRRGEGRRCGGLRPGSSSDGLETTSSGPWPAQMRSSGSVRWVAAVRLDSHGGEVRSEEWLTEELEVAMAERRLQRASSGGWRGEHGRGSSEARRRGGAPMARLEVAGTGSTTMKLGDGVDPEQRE